ncbi:MAG: hypothetical protein AEth_00701 [Candidatus Argoarchaeum ethanivorans]|uniref:Uncharacterized protein n=1 Tax=Candidatus Argoarchaeum ethanivorans TaxID=2608793 RepID=A0A8B3S3I5_9EURY|nr:MAG: hypothetical protein AEth_00701 [Candidatus Argoarchaeum ethanivorans]
MQLRRKRITSKSVQKKVITDRKKHEHPPDASDIRLEVVDCLCTRLLAQSRIKGYRLFSAKRSFAVLMQSRVVFAHGVCGSAQRSCAVTGYLCKAQLYRLKVSVHCCYCLCNQFCSCFKVVNIQCLHW